MRLFQPNPQQALAGPRATRMVGEVDGLLAAAQNFVAVERGGRVPVDLSDRWNHWGWVEKPLAQAGAELGVTPLPG